MNNEFTLPVTYSSVTRNLPEVTKLPTVTYPQVSRGRAADCSILQPKAKRQSRTQSKKLTGSLSNTQKGGGIYDGSAQKKYGSRKRRRTQIGAVRIRKNRLSGHIRNGHLNDIRIEELITAEARRLSEQFGKAFLDCEDIVKLTGLGRDNVRGLMHKRCFPVVKAGNRQVVSILAFVTWQMTEYLKGENSYGELKLAQVTPNIIQGVLNKMLVAGYSLAYVRKVKFLLNQFFAYAKANRFINDNPVSECIVKSTPEHKERKQETYKAIPIEIREYFLEVISKNDFMKALCMVQMFAGLRIGEALALKWKNVDFDNGIISIDSAVTELPVRNSEGKIVDHRTVISDTKTAASIREVPMPNILKTTLLEWKKFRWVQQRTTGKSFIGPNDLVFANNEGELRTYTGTKTIFQRLMSQYGLAPYKLHFHSLRHTYSSMLVESRENPKVIQMLLGHKDVTTTIRTYNSVDRSYFKQAVDKLDSKFHFDDD